MSRHVLIPFGGEWRYRHAEGPPPGEWTSPAYDDHAWSAGTAPLGYSTKETGTRIYPGPSFKLRPAAGQFRHTFTLDDPATLAGVRLTLAVHRNQGIRVFLNEDLVAWDGVPWPAFGDDLTTNAFTNADTTAAPLHFTISSRALRAGANTVAVDMRHAQRAYGALTFDLSLAAGEGPIDRSAFAASIAEPDVTAVRAGDAAPDFEWIEAFTKRTRRLSELAGTPFLLQFSGAECRPCWKKLPAIRRWADAGLRCLSISSWGTVEDMEVPAARHTGLLEGIAVGAEPNAYDAYQTACYRRFGIFNGSILVDADGRILSVATGFTMEEFLPEAAAIDTLLGERGYAFGPVPEHVGVVGGADDWRVVVLPRIDTVEAGASMLPSTG